MAFFLGLLALTTTVWLISKFILKSGPYQSFWSAGRLAVAFMFVQVGLMHLLKPEAFSYMIEGIIPYPIFLVYLSGVAEIMLGLGILFHKTAEISAWLLILMLLAIFPANINVAVKDLASPGGLPSEPWYRWSRLAFQPLYIFWVYRSILFERRKVERNLHQMQHQDV